MIETVKKDDLCLLAKAVEIMQYTIREITEDFFDKFNSDIENDRASILWEFNRSRAKAGVLEDYLHIMEKELEKYGITYWSK